MGQKQYLRNDLTFSISRNRDKAVEVVASGPSKGVSQAVEIARQRFDAESLHVGSKSDPLEVFLQSTAGEWKSNIESQEYDLNRIVFEIDDPALSVFPWEQSAWRLKNELPCAVVAAKREVPRLVVRTTRVVPRLTAIPFVLPLRILQVHDDTEDESQSMIPAVIENMVKDAGGSNSAVASRCTWKEFDSRLEKTQGRSLDVLHFTNARLLDSEDALSMAEPDRVGTAGWLCRLAEQFRTRLVIVEVEPDLPHSALKRLAASVVARGGPAIALVCRLCTSGLWEGFYSALIHDLPLDAAYARSFWSGCPSQILFAGAGREEALRVSSPGAILSAFNVDLPTLDRSALPPAWQEDIGVSSTDRKWLNSVRPQLQQFREDWAAYRFDFSEGFGLKPLSDAFGEFRTLRRKSFDGTTIDLDSTILESVAAEPEPPPRHLNAAFWTSNSNARLTRIFPADAGRLDVDATYHFGLQVGPRDEFMATVGVQELVEEIFAWDPSKPGVWIEVGVTGLDFDVMGDRLQEVWLPRIGPTEKVFFSVIPRRAGTSELRYCLYYRQNLIQSWRIAAVTQAADRREASDASRKSVLANALEIREEESQDVIYLARCEYSTTSLNSVDRLPPRDLCLFVNRHLDQSVITVKIPGELSISEDFNSVLYTKKSRVALSIASTNGGNYRFLPGNNGNDENFREALIALADAGWAMFSAAFGSELEQKVREQLDRPGCRISVGQLKFEKIIPWALMYDRRFDSNCVPPPQVCTAALPSAGGATIAPEMRRESAMSAAWGRDRRALGCLSAPLLGIPA